MVLLKASNLPPHRYRSTGILIAPQVAVAAENPDVAGGIATTFGQRPLMVNVCIASGHCLATAGTMFPSSGHRPMMKTYFPFRLAIVPSPHLQTTTTRRVGLRVLNGVVHLLRPDSEFLTDRRLTHPGLVKTSGNRGLACSFDSHILFYHDQERVGK